MKVSETEKRIIGELGDIEKKVTDFQLLLDFPCILVNKLLNF